LADETYIRALRAAAGQRLLLMPGARLVLQRGGGEILLQLRADFRRWGLIGGNPEPGESLDATIRREAKEELGIRLDELQPFGFSSNPALETIQYPNGDRCQYFGMLFACRSFTGQPEIADEESLKIGWFKPEDLPQPLIATVQPTLSAFRAWEETGQFQML
jgi:8-oxo-dGTP pyrophosphatase MutT (NUDIX family)